MESLPRAPRESLSLNKKNRKDLIKWIISAVIVPIMVAALASGILDLKNKPTNYVYQEIPSLDKFNVFDYYPLNEGNYWVYILHTKYQNNGSKIYEEEKTLKQKVLQVYKNDSYTLATMQGNPFSSEVPIELKEQYGLLIISNKVYYVPKEVLDDAIENITSKEYSFYNLDYSAITLLFEFPLYDGQKIGDIEHITREDLKYITNVEKEESYERKVNGRLETTPVYSLKNVAGGGNERITFIPSIGITAYEYVHFGTVQEVQLDLKDYYISGLK